MRRRVEGEKAKVEEDPEERKKDCKRTSSIIIYLIISLSFYVSIASASCGSCST